MSIEELMMVQVPIELQQQLVLLSTFSEKFYNEKFPEELEQNLSDPENLKDVMILIAKELLKIEGNRIPLTRKNNDACKKLLALLQVCDEQIARYSSELSSPRTTTDGNQMSDQWTQGDKTSRIDMPD